MKYVVFDTETTGLGRRSVSDSKPCSLQEYGDEVIQVGGLVFNHRWEIDKVFCHGCDCLRAASTDKAFAVHNIDMQEQRMFVSNIFLDEVIWRYLPEFLYDDVVFLGYNAEFDFRMVRQSLRNSPFTFKDARRAVTVIPKVGRHYIDVMHYWNPWRKLSSFENELREEMDNFIHQNVGRVTISSNIYADAEDDEVWGHLHNALYDATLTYLVFRKYILNQKIFGGGR